MIDPIDMKRAPVAQDPVNPTENQFEVLWQDSGREPTCAPDPSYPDGIDIVLAPTLSGEPFCTAKLPHPAKRCGFYIVRCRLCSHSAAITTAGRPDDPRSVTMLCHLNRASVQ
jgi:hypothetical protein